MEVTEVLNSIKTDLGEFATGAKGKILEQDERLSQIEQRLSRGSGAGMGTLEEKSVGERVTSHAQCKAFLEQGMRSSGRIPITSFFTKSAIVSDGSLFNLPQRVPDISAIYLPMRLRDLLVSSPASSNIIEFVRESSSTNAAAPQGWGSSPQIYENVAKAESALAFELAAQPIVTLASWIPASRQVLDDSAALQNFVNRRLQYFLKLTEENQLLNGSGANGDLTGFMTVASSYQSPSPIPPTETRLDSIRRAIGQVERSGFSATGVVVAPDDWTAISLIKTQGTASSGEYVYSDPHAPGSPSVWGRPLVISSKMAVGSFLVGDFSVAGCQLWDRMQSSVEISREHADFFTRNMVAILCEERLALTIYQSAAFVSGNF
jgi:HK97 family phage major capsid protein